MSTDLARARVRRRSDVVAVELDGRVVVFHEPTGRVRSFNPTGSMLWRVLDGTSTVGELADAIAEELGVEPSVARADVRSFVAGLIRYRFAERVD
jgi:hypothetical protein